MNKAIRIIVYTGLFLMMTTTHYMKNSEYEVTRIGCIGSGRYVVKSK